MRRDDVVVAAIKHVVQDLYGADVTRAEPQLVGGGIVLTGANETSYILLVKEDSGETHSLVIRREPRTSGP